MWIIKIIKIKCFYSPRILDEHWCIYSCLQIPPRENWFQYVRRVYTTAINFPSISTLGTVVNRALPSLHGGSLEITLTVPLGNVKSRFFKSSREDSLSSKETGIKEIFKPWNGFFIKPLDSGRNRLTGILQWEPENYATNVVFVY